MPRLHAVVTGRVQGVGFRWFVRGEADRLGLAGWVRNHPDGSVEVAAEGDDATIARFRKSLSSGPDGAHVEQVRELPTASLADLPRPFAIHR